MEYPLRVREYAVRRGSGGVGTWAGGDGVIREFEALAPMEATLLTERRRHRPRGAAGGADGSGGANILNGSRLPAKTALRIAPGDVLRIETPGGGGWGKPEDKP
jgi:N-methylhydantoinase B